MTRPGWLSMLAVAATCCLLVSCGGSGPEVSTPPDAAPVVPADAAPVTAVERDGVTFELLSADGCAYLRTTNLTDGVSAADEQCHRHGFARREGCLAQGGEDADGAGDSSEGPPCTSEIEWEAVWGRVDVDSVGAACMDSVGAPVTAGGEFLIVVSAGSPVQEPGFLLQDGRPVQGPAWGTPLDEAAAATCRETTGLPSPEFRPVVMPFEVEHIEALGNDGAVVAVRTDTGYLALFDIGLAEFTESLSLYPDTRTVTIQVLDDEQDTVLTEQVAPLSPDVWDRVDGGRCQRLVVSLDPAGSGSTRLADC